MRLISCKEKIENQLAKKGKKHRHVFLGLITFDQSQEGCAEVFTSFQLISYLSTLLISKIGVLKQSRKKIKKLALGERLPERLLLHAECMDD